MDRISKTNMITDLFIQKGLKIVPEVTDSRFSMVDDGAVEVESGELIYGFIKRLKPNNCLSTGTYTGISDLYLAQALKDNGFGHLDAVEYEQFHIDRARKLWEQMGVAQIITSINSDSLKFEPDKQYQFMFLDSEPWLRLHELVKFFSFLDEGGFVFIHDMPRNLCKGNFNPDHPEIVNWPVREFPPEFDQMLKEDKLRIFHFGSARGMIGLYKPTAEDYSWKT